MSAGGGASSSNAGGLYEGARNKCMGLSMVWLFGPPICAACGLANDGSTLFRPAGLLLSSCCEAPTPLNVLASETGELRRFAAPGHPQSNRCALFPLCSGDVYAGSEMLFCVARQERMWNGESIEISKCRRFVGSLASGFDRRMTICLALVFVFSIYCDDNSP